MEKKISEKYLIATSGEDITKDVSLEKFTHFIRKIKFSFDVENMKKGEERKYIYIYMLLLSVTSSYKLACTFFNLM